MKDIFEKVNLIVIFSTDEKSVLMCRRSRDPYKGKLNFVGGHVEKGETDEESAYRELFEETGISRGDAMLTRVLYFEYFIPKVELQVFAGKLSHDVELVEEEHELLWVSLGEDFNDTSRFAGSSNIRHIMLEITEYKDAIFKTAPQAPDNVT